VKANKTLSSLKKALSAIGIGLKLFARFFTQLGSRPFGWPAVGERPQRNSGRLVQEADEAPEAGEARIREDKRQARIWEDERRDREVQEARTQENERQARIREDERRDREVQEARTREDERQARIREDERRNREKAKAFSQADAARLAWEDQLHRRQLDRGHDGPRIGI
jgi:hypothetical protein